MEDWWFPHFSRRAMERRPYLCVAAVKEVGMKKACRFCVGIAFLQVCERLERKHT